jgi:hypothetical protein
MQLSWVGEQIKKSYKDFMRKFDAMTDDDVRWTSYTAEAIHSRARDDLLSLCL